MNTEKLRPGDVLVQRRGLHVGARYEVTRVGATGVQLRALARRRQRLDRPFTMPLAKIATTYEVER